MKVLLFSALHYCDCVLYFTFYFHRFKWLFALVQNLFHTNMLEYEHQPNRGLLSEESSFMPGRWRETIDVGRLINNLWLHRKIHKFTLISISVHQSARNINAFFVDRKRKKRINVNVALFFPSLCTQNFRDETKIIIKILCILKICLL